MLIARAFNMTRRNGRFESGSGPPALTAIVSSLPMRAKALDILSQRANIVCLRVSKMRPMGVPEERDLRGEPQQLGTGKFSPWAGALQSRRRARLSVVILRAAKDLVADDARCVGIGILRCAQDAG